MSVLKTDFNIGDIVTGVVTGIENYGIFVSLGEHGSGLIHISEVSDYFVRNINDYVELNETIYISFILSSSFYFIILYRYSL